MNFPSCLWRKKGVGIYFGLKILNIWINKGSLHTIRSLGFRRKQPVLCYEQNLRSKNSFYKIRTAILNTTKKFLSFISYPINFTFDITFKWQISFSFWFNISNTVYKTWFTQRELDFEQKLKSTEKNFSFGNWKHGNLMNGGPKGILNKS